MRYSHSLGSMASVKLDTKLKCPLDYVLITLRLVENLLTWPDCEDESKLVEPYVTIITEKNHQRAYFIKQNQIVSFAFPFVLCSKDDASTKVKTWHVRYRSLDITPIILSNCLSLHDDVIKNQNKTYQEIAQALNQADPEVVRAIRLFEMLIQTEPGYIRYDYDNSNAKGHKHPLYHLDMNFVKSYHYKIGLHHRMTVDKVFDLINNDTNSWYIAPYKVIQIAGISLLFERAKMKFRRGDARKIIGKIRAHRQKSV